MELDLESIKEQLEEVIRYSKGYQNIPIDCSEIISKWYENKKDFIEMFNGQLIYEFPIDIDIEANEDEKTLLFNSFLLNIDLSNTDLVNHIKLNKEGFFNNTLVDNTYTPSIKEGSKLFKSFKYFIKNAELRYTQDLASQAMQSNRVKGGVLCLSVHPLDFITISENNNHWTTCHSIDGSHGAGNYSYMMDNSSFVIYLKSKDDVQLRPFPKGMLWNNKKWRAMGFMPQSRECIWVSSQYPRPNLKLVEFLISDKSPFYQKFNLLENCFNQEEIDYAYIDENKFSADVENRIIPSMILDDEVIMNEFFIRKKYQDSFEHNDLIDNRYFSCNSILIRNSEDKNKNKEDEMKKLKNYFFSILPELKATERINMGKFYSSFDEQIPKEYLKYVVKVGENFKPICGHDKEFYRSGEDLVCVDCGELINRKMCSCCEQTIYEGEELNKDNLCIRCTKILEEFGF